MNVPVAATGHRIVAEMAQAFARDSGPKIESLRPLAHEDEHVPHADAPPHVRRPDLRRPRLQLYGVGMPIILKFDRPITNRRAVERALSLRTSKRLVGAWYWDGDTTLYFRPRTCWPAHTRVRFVARLTASRARPASTARTPSLRAL